ncbi:MAG: type 1 glutamine amidotransferase [Actinobacteria bacterium]|nr:type 1 glutamine amidotransferase [Actinomycetota bacterium]
MTYDSFPDARPIVLAIQNDPTDPPLLVGEWLAEDGIRVEVITACFGETVPESVPLGVHGILSLGGVMGANDDVDAPWLVQERALLVDAVERGVPVLGLCLGGQLLAAATGGTVELGPITEIGVVQVQRTVDGLRDPVMAQAVPYAGADIPAAQWHQDHITELPDGAVLLPTNAACRVQGFRVGDSAYGLQLHPEIDAQTFADWAGMVDEALERSGLDPALLMADMFAAEHQLIAAWRPMTRAWADLVWARARDAQDAPTPT